MSCAFPRLARLCLAGACLLVPQPGRGNPSVPSSLPLPAGSAQAPLGDALRVYGMPTAVRVFDTPMPLADAIQWFSAWQPALADLSVLPGLAVLSGMVSGQLWVVSLQPHGASRTHGSVAALDLHTADLPRRCRPAWLPSEARLHLDFQVDDVARARVQVWSYAVHPTRLQARLDQGLAREGWQRQAGVDGGLHRWVRGRAAITLDVAPAGQGSGLLVRHEEPLP